MFKVEDLNKIWFVAQSPNTKTVRSHDTVFGLYPFFWPHVKVHVDAMFLRFDGTDSDPSKFFFGENELCHRDRCMVYRFLLLSILEKKLAFSVVQHWVVWR